MAPNIRLSGEYGRQAHGVALVAFGRLDFLPSFLQRIPPIVLEMGNALRFSGSHAISQASDSLAILVDPQPGEDSDFDRVQCQSEADRCREQHADDNRRQGRH